NGEEDGEVRPEAERGNPAQPPAPLGQQINQLPSPGTPPFHERGLRCGDRPPRSGGVREGAEAGFGGHVASPGSAVGLGPDGALLYVTVRTGAEGTHPPRRNSNRPNSGQAPRNGTAQDRDHYGPPRVPAPSPL